MLRTLALLPVALGAYMAFHVAALYGNSLGMSLDILIGLAFEERALCHD